MKEQLKDYFHFSKGEKKGIVILLFLILILIIIPPIYSIFIKSDTRLSKEFEQQIAEFHSSLTEVEKPEINNRLNQYIIERYDSLELFHFNPNTANKDDFKNLGLTEKQIKTLLNYRNKGGKFYTKDDFRKIYGIRNQQFQILKPYLLLPGSKSTNYNYKQTDTKTNYKSKDSLFVFDPNKCSDNEYTNLGFSDKQVKTIRNYLNKVGKFSTKDDFKKIYGIPNQLYNKVEPYIHIQKEIVEPAKNIVLIELNTASVEELENIKGIGNYTAKSIIKYRTKLGGFTNTRQLLEIEKLNKEYFQNYKDQLTVNLSKITKLSLNFSEISDFVKHPYINFQQAKKIVEYRTKNGAFTKKESLIKNNLLDNNSYKKVEQYLELN